MSSSLGLRQQMLERLAKAQSAAVDGGISLRSRIDARRQRQRATVLIVEADEIVRLGLRTALSADGALVVVGDAESVADATRLGASLRPQVAVVGGEFPDGSALDVCGRLHETAPATRTIILARDVGAASVVEAVRAGAAGYFTKRVARRDLCRAVRAIASGEVLIDSVSTRMLLDGIRQGATPGTQPAGTTPLAVQERRVLALVAQGKTNKEIAVELHLSDKTVKNYLSHAFEKLNVSRRAQAAVLFAQINGSVRNAS
jgi:two-component system, NarL family, response regulator DevR